MTVISTFASTADPVQGFWSYPGSTGDLHPRYTPAGPNQRGIDEDGCHRRPRPGTAVGGGAVQVVLGHRYQSISGLLTRGGTGAVGKRREAIGPSLQRLFDYGALETRQLSPQFPPGVIQRGLQRQVPIPERVVLIGRGDMTQLGHHPPHLADIQIKRPRQHLEVLTRGEQLGIDHRPIQGHLTATQPVLRARPATYLASRPHQVACRLRGHIQTGRHPLGQVAAPIPHRSLRIVQPAQQIELTSPATADLGLQLHQFGLQRLDRRCQRLKHATQYEQRV